MPDVAWVILAVAVLLAVLTAYRLVRQRGFQSLVLKGPLGLEVDLSAVRRVEEKVDRVVSAAERLEVAVNHVDEGEPPLIARVRTLERSHARQEQRSAWTVAAIHDLATHLGVPITPPPPPEDPS